MECTMGVFKLQDNYRDSLPLSSITSFIPATILPEPTYTPPDPKKKPHAKKQPTGHIPRPRNAFILFRCDFVRQKKIPVQVEKDHRNISRIVGQIWRQMSDKQREPWVLMADEERMAHSKLYPTFRFSTGVSIKKSKRGDDIPHETQKSDDYFWDDLDLLDLYRSSSCPPGTLHVPQANLESCNGYGAPLKTRDDMTRRPSRVTFYQSKSASPPVSQEELSDIHNQHCFTEFTKEDYSKAVANQDFYMGAEEQKATSDEHGDLEAKFCEPRINIHPYSTPSPDDPPEWDAAPTQPYTWTDWSNFQFDQSSAGNGICERDTNIPHFTNPFLSTLPPLPGCYDSHDTFSPVDYVLQPSFTSLETDAPSTCSPLDSYQLPYTPPEYVPNIGTYHSNTSDDPSLRTQDNIYHHTSQQDPMESSFSDGLPLAPRFQPDLGGHWDNKDAPGGWCQVFSLADESC